MPATATTLAIALAGTAVGVVLGVLSVYTSTRESYHAAGVLSGINRANLRVIDILRREIRPLPGCDAVDPGLPRIELAASKTAAIMITTSGARVGFCQYE